MEEYAGLRSGDLSQRLHKLVGKEQLAALGRQLDLGACIRRGGAQRNSPVNVNVMADVFEAITGALFRDGGLAVVYATIGPLFDGPVAAAVGGEDKGALITYAQRMSLPQPMYYDGSYVIGPIPGFQYHLTFAGQTYTAVATNKRDGEKACASQAVSALRAQGANI